jgi:glycosyltransferase involved in cell wall biosynthesis
MHEVTEGHALIADFGKAAEATKALRDLATNQELRRRLSSGGLQRAQRFTFEKFTSERIDAIRRRLFEQSIAPISAAHT